MPDRKWTYPPATPGGPSQSVTCHEDGSVTVRDANGVENHYDPQTGNRSTTPPVPPVVTPGSRQVQPDGEIRVAYGMGDLRVRFISAPPARFEIIRDNTTPREEEFNLVTGRRGVVQQPDGAKVETDPASTQRLPSTHPKGGAAGGNGTDAKKGSKPKKKGKSRAPARKKASARRAKPARAAKAKKRPAARRGKKPSRR